jgi:hypothetical protein
VDFGNAVYSWDRGESWSDIQGNNGLSDWWIFNDDSLFAVGYGMIQKITHNWNLGYRGYTPTVTELSFSGDYFTGIWFTNNKTGYLSGFDGGIYKTVDGGLHWSEVYKRNSVIKKRIHFNDVIFETENIGWVCGLNGLLMKTSDAGNTWQKVDANTSNNLKSMFFNNNKLYITSENGMYFIVKE